MIRPLNRTTKHYATTETEAKEYIAEITKKTKGTVTKQNIDRKTHKDYGDYFELTIVETYTTSKSILENGI